MADHRIAYTLDQAAQVMGCDPSKTAEMLSAGDLPGEKFGRGWWIPVEPFHARLAEIAVELRSVDAVPYAF